MVVLYRLVGLVHFRRIGIRKWLMNTRNREDIIRTAGIAFLRDAFVKDIRSLEALCLENHIHARSEGTMIETSKGRCS